MNGRPIWLTDGKEPHPPLRGRQQAEVAVIGGGICGVTTAYLLAQNGMRVVLLEANRIGYGTTSHNMAKVTVQHGLIYSRLKKTWGSEVAQAYAACQTGALKAMADLIEQQHISCGWTWQTSSLAALDREEEILLEKEEAASQEAGITASLKSGEECPIPVRCLLSLPDQAMFDPYAYVCALADGFVKMGGRIYESSRVRSVNTQCVSTETGSVYAPFVVIATHFPIINIPGWYFLRLRQQRSYIAAISDAPSFQGMYLHIADGGFSLRRHDGWTLLSTCNYTCGTQTNVDHGELIRQRSKVYFPDANPSLEWHGQDLVSADGLPLVGPYSRRTPNHFVATGFFQWGMTNSMAAARTISARILGTPLAESEILQPSRTMKHSAVPVVATLTKNSATRLSGIRRIKAPRCPHMGCRLKYVSSTASWDCPCHGSRFDSIGRILNEPAVRPAAIQNKNRPG